MKGTVLPVNFFPVRTRINFSSEIWEVNKTDFASNHIASKISEISNKHKLNAEKTSIALVGFPNVLNELKD